MSFEMASNSIVQSDLFTQVTEIIDLKYKDSRSFSFFEVYSIGERFERNYNYFLTKRLKCSWKNFLISYVDLLNLFYKKDIISHVLPELKSDLEIYNVLEEISFYKFNYFPSHCAKLVQLLNCSLRCPNSHVYIKSTRIFDDNEIKRKQEVCFSVPKKSPMNLRLLAAQAVLNGSDEFDTREIISMTSNSDS